MRIQFNPQHIAPIYKKNLNQNNKNIENNSKTYTYNPISYQDYNLTFTGRTPEDFYVFNSKSMPYTMKNYLNYDYEQRQHMPPEQMMNEVFKHLDKAKNFEDVKKDYPNEDLFKNLHSLKKNARKGILSEIKIAREISDIPLLNDGSDDFGLYLLKKIYKEGKTLKEINKDFLEKDINKEYKGFITESIDYSTTAAYGIKFPDNGFWHSFISTRDEYKKFFITLPKNTVDPNRSESQKKQDSVASSPRSRTNADSESKPAKPRYRIKTYQKEQLKKDIKSTKGDIESVEKAVRRRFSKDDPEASFIIKYLSPIMTIAADKVHLSEEMRYFYEFDTNTEGKSKIERFWKSNPELLENYSMAITDTIELFENVFGAGGMIPINSDYEQITSKSANQHPIDFVTPEFIELLDYTQNIKPERDKRYAAHDEEQKQWEAHFLERYGEIGAESKIIEEKEIKPERQKIDIQDALNKAIAQNPGTQVFKFAIGDDTNVSLAINLKEVITQQIANEYRFMPKSYINKFSNYIFNHPKLDEKHLLSYACNVNNMAEWGNFLIDDSNYSEDELQELNAKAIKEIQSQLLPEDEIFNTMRDIRQEFEEKNPKYMNLVRQAMMEYSTKLQKPEDNYLNSLIVEKYKQMEDLGLINAESQAEKLSMFTNLYDKSIESIETMKNHDIAFLNTNSLEIGLSFLSIGNNTDDLHIHMEKIMQKYKTPLSNSERNKILRRFMDTMLNLNPYNSYSMSHNSISGFYKVCMELLKRKENANIKKDIMRIVNETIITPQNTTLRYVLEANADKNLVESMIEKEIAILIQNNIDIFKMLASLDIDLMDKYIKNTEPNLYNQLLMLRNEY
ncbi:hypothetical protein HDR58_00330 [bacterium]|nr:hypothetical protein [bacterium]